MRAVVGTGMPISRFPIDANPNDDFCWYINTPIPDIERGQPISRTCCSRMPEEHVPHSVARRAPIRRSMSRAQTHREATCQLSKHPDKAADAAEVVLRGKQHHSRHLVHHNPKARDVYMRCGTAAVSRCLKREAG